MGEVTWGELAKEVQDKTTVSEEIDAKILTHNLDPSGHGQANEAVYEHRVAEILDHLDSSITAAKLAQLSVDPSKYNYDRPYQIIDWTTLDAFLLSGVGTETAFLRGGFAMLDTGEVTNDTCSVTSAFEPEGIDFSTYDYIFTTRFLFTDENGGVPPNILSYVGFGHISQGWAGFRYENGYLYAKTINGGVVYETEISGITIYEMHTYVILHTHGVRTEFYIDGALIHTETVHPASSGGLGVGMHFYVKTKANFYKEIQVQNTSIVRL